MRQIGFLLADKTAGRFELEIRSIEFIGPEDADTSDWTALVQGSVERARVSLLCPFTLTRNPSISRKMKLTRSCANLSNPWKA